MIASLVGFSRIMFMPVCNSAGMKFAWTMKMQMYPFSRGSVLLERETRFRSSVIEMISELLEDLST
jgi:hypothetical protein